MTIKKRISKIWIVGWVFGLVALLFTFHIGDLGCIPVFSSGSKETMVIAGVIRFLPSIWETWFQFSTSWYEASPTRDCESFLGNESEELRFSLSLSQSLLLVFSVFFLSLKKLTMIFHESSHLGFPNSHL